MTDSPWDEEVTPLPTDEQVERFKAAAGPDIVERLGEAMVGHPHAKIPWPHRILHDARDTIETQRAEIERLRSAMTEFCERVERGEVRSKRTYAKFNALLGRRAALSGKDGV